MWLRNGALAPGAGSAVVHLSCASLRSTTTLKSLRKQLEGDLGLEPDALKPHKHLLSDLIDQVTTARPQTARRSTSPLSPFFHFRYFLRVQLIAKSSKDTDADEGGAPKAQRKKQRAAEEGKAKPSRAGKSGKEAAAAKGTGPRQYSKHVEKLRTLCKQATITIPPTLYVKNKSDGERTAALEALRDKHGLSSGSGPNDVARAKQQLQTMRDLDGIDTSNIVEGGRRQRGGDRISYR